ncbi:MAG TPA: hypothetical protein VGF46_09310, partial [Gaiellales bacterium]
MTPRRIAVLPLLAAASLVPWAVYLALSLPGTHTAAHWQVAWTGFDLGLAGAFAATAWAAERRPELLAPILLATATVMTCDSWFDLATAFGTADQAVALLEAALELPLAVACATVAVRLSVRRPSAAATARARSRSRARSRCS